VSDIQLQNIEVYKLNSILALFDSPMQDKIISMCDEKFGYNRDIRYIVVSGTDMETIVRVAWTYVHPYKDSSEIMAKLPQLAGALVAFSGY